MEEYGIGRPSTYAPTISTILDRHYIEREQKQLKPTPLGDVITALLSDHFEKIVDTKFTAKMEHQLDEIEEGKIEWVKVLDSFYKDFAKTLEKAEHDMEGKRVKVPNEPTDIVCEQCGKHMVIKIGPYGKFLGCEGFPECKNTKPYLEKTGGICPECGGDLVKRKSKKGRTFYSCSNYPKCEFVSWDTPTSQKCPVCGNTMFTKGFGKRKRTYCGYCESHGKKAN